MKLHYHRIDVFTDRPFGGNPLAVFSRGETVPPEHMQAIARELNLSETTFVLPPEDPANDFRVRIFTPCIEMPMAGHPTVGTAFALARERRIRPDEHGRARVVFEEGVGPIAVSLSFEGQRPASIGMQQPLPRFAPPPVDRAGAAALLSLDIDAIDPTLPIEMVSCGVDYLIVPVRGLSGMRAIEFRVDLGANLFGDATPGVFAFCRETESADAHVHGRMFAPAAGVPEDPATGSAAGPMGCYLVRHAVAPSPFDIEQGFEMGRPSRLHVEIEGAADAITGVHVSGRSVAVGEGFLDI